jgi:hypothetical protein
MRKRKNKRTRKRIVGRTRKRKKMRKMIYSWLDEKEEEE